ncbi:hypothetical protein CRUP_005909, partial [Coryphaenoides rupestris]
VHPRSSIYLILEIAVVQGAAVAGEGWLWGFVKDKGPKDERVIDAEMRRHGLRGFWGPSAGSGWSQGSRRPSAGVLQNGRLLSISPVTAASEGAYVCVAEEEYVMWMNTHTVTVEKQTSYTLKIHEGSEVNLLCMRPPHILYTDYARWHKVSPDGNITLLRPASGMEEAMAEVMTEDVLEPVGEAVAEAVSELEEENEAESWAKPEFEVEEVVESEVEAVAEVVVEEGTVKAVVEGIVEAVVEVNRVEWLFASPVNSDQTISIQGLVVGDSGTYQCESAAGEIFSSIHLIVEVTPTKPPHTCADPPSAPEPCGEPAGRGSRSGAAILRESLAEFSVRLYRHLRPLRPAENLLFSPISISGLLSHLLLGARGVTRRHLEDALCLPRDFSCVHVHTDMVRRALSGSLHLASQIYHSPGLVLRESFLNQSLEFYGSRPAPLLGDGLANAQLVNRWVAQNTQGLITHLVDTLPPETQLVLLNARLEAGLSDQALDHMMRKVRRSVPELVEVTLPEIRLDVETDMDTLLRKLGLGDLFQGAPNLCGIQAEVPVALDEARHRATLALTEDGVEAAAATATLYSRSSPAFAATRPFVLLLWSDVANAPLFMGRVTRP